jgi:hypothetical protein
MKGHEIEQMDLIAQPGQPKSVNAGSAADVEDNGWRRREETGQELAGPLELEPAAARSQTMVFES